MPPKGILLLMFVITPLSSCQDTFVEDIDGSQPYTGEEAVIFSKRVYSVLGTKDVSKLADEFRMEYKILNSNGMLGSMLGALYDMRIEDLLLSLERVKKMREVLDRLESSDS